MKYFFPPKNQNYTYLQTNRSDDLGSLWSTKNLDFQTNLGTMRLAQKLVTNTTSSDDADLGLPVAFEYLEKWWAICGTRIFKNSSKDLTSTFTEDPSAYNIGTATSRFDVSNPAGTTFRYTWDGTGTDPGITALSVPIGATVVVSAGTNFAAGNRGTFTVTGSGANYFEVTNAAGVVEVDKTLGVAGYIAVTGGTFGQQYSINQSDLAVFNLGVWSTTTNKLYFKVFGEDRWQLVANLSLSGVHKLAYLKKFNRLYATSSASFINSVDENNTYTGSTGDYYINLGVSIGNITTIVASSDTIWIGTVNNSDSVTTPGANGHILAWDGISAQVTYDYVLPAAGVVAMCLDKEVPYALDTEGRLLKFTGSSFEEFTRLPVDRILLTNSTVELPTNGRFVHYNGMSVTKNNTIQILVNNLNDDAGGTINENLPSGIWECDLATGNFTHRYSPTLKAFSSSTVTDYGQNRILAAGALKMNTFESTSSNGRSTLLAGFSYYTTASATKSGIFIDSPAKPNTDNEGQKRGYFVTTWFNSDEIQDKWTRLWATFRRFLNSTDKIIFKYRLNEEDPTYATITWVTTSTFTTNTDISAYSPTATGFNSTVGGEVEILQGTGSGACVHITNVASLMGTYTVTIDNAISNVSGTAKARFQKWIKLFPEITGQVLSYGSTAIGGSNTRIQIKGVMEFTGDDEFHKMAIWSNEDIKINA